MFNLALFWRGRRCPPTTQNLTDYNVVPHIFHLKCKNGNLRFREEIPTNSSAAWVSEYSRWAQIFSKGLCSGAMIQTKQHHSHITHRSRLGWIRSPKALKLMLISLVDLFFFYPEHLSIQTKHNALWAANQSSWNWQNSQSWDLFIWFPLDNIAGLIIPYFYFGHTWFHIEMITINIKRIGQAFFSISVEPNQ